MRRWKPIVIVALGLFLTACAPTSIDGQAASVCTAYKDALRTLVVFQISDGDRTLLKRADSVLYPSCKAASTGKPFDINSMRDALRQLVIIQQRAK